jgi:co-chaperonin GroES (HSP10)
MSEKEKIPRIEGAQGASDPAELAWAFPQVNAGQEPFGGRVIVQLKRIRKTAANSRIILTQSAREDEKWQNMIGKVVSIGPLAFKNRETMKPWPEGTWAQVGDYVRVPKWGGDRWERTVPGEVEGDDPVLFMTLNDHELISKVTDDPLSYKTFV